MKFICERTSVWNDIRPCEEAKQELIKHTEYRTRSIEYLKKHLPGSLHGDGSEYHNCRGGCKRDYTKTRWVVEFNTLEELIAFKEKYGDLVLRHDCLDSELPVVEIYDSYRE
jgi:hypothetical protein